MKLRVSLVLIDLHYCVPELRVMELTDGKGSKGLIDSGCGIFE